MDGTLTHAIHDFEAIRAQLGLPPGQPILEALDALPADEAKALHQQLDEIEYDIAYQATAQPGATRLLDALLARDCTVGILTRNGKGIAAATLEAAGLQQYFDSHSTVTRDCCAPKPDPAGVHLLLSRWQAEPGTAVMTGDYLYDLQAGHTAGLATVHMDISAQYPWPELTTLAVASLEELATRIGA